MGQWMVYPNVNEIEKYDGVLYPGNFVKIKEDLESKGMLDRLDKMVSCSGKLAYLLYKEDIEAAMRTRGLSGFQLLGLFDYPGQGMSTVGMLESMWDSKGIITPGQFKSFCNDRVLLLELEKYEWTNSEILKGQVNITNYSKKNLQDETVEISITDNNKNVLYKNKWLNVNADFGRLSPVGRFSFDLSGLSEAVIMEITLEAIESGIKNSWEIFISPDVNTIFTDIVLTDNITEDVISQLNEGAKALCVLNTKTDNQVNIAFTNTFWNPLMRSEQAKTNGLIIDSRHDIFKLCPNNEYTQWFHWDMLNNAKCICIDGYNRLLNNIISVIDNFTDNRNLSMLMETTVGKGNLVITTIDLFNEAKVQYVRQLKNAVISYMKFSVFNPQVEIDISLLTEFSKNLS
jgi:hypothetical protein